MDHQQHFVSQQKQRTNSDHQDDVDDVDDDDYDDDDVDGVDDDHHHGPCLIVFGWRCLVYPGV